MPLLVVVLWLVWLVWLVWLAVATGTIVRRRVAVVVSIVHPSPCAVQVISRVIVVVIIIVPTSTSTSTTSTTV